eukprot:scaffold412_cov116-Isochrysis_galbana.AAC.6
MGEEWEGGEGEGEWGVSGWQGLTSFTSVHQPADTPRCPTVRRSPVHCTWLPPSLSARLLIRVFFIDHHSYGAYSVHYEHARRASFVVKDGTVGQLLNSNRQ